MTITTTFRPTAVIVRLSCDPVQVDGHGRSQHPDRPPQRYLLRGVEVEMTARGNHTRGLGARIFNNGDMREVNDWFTLTDSELRRSAVAAAIRHLNAKDTTP